MTDNRTTPRWPRLLWTPAEERAVVVFFVFGGFGDEPLQIPAARHGSAGLPAEFEMLRHPQTALAGWEGHPLSGALGEVLATAHPELVERARRAPEVLTIRGEVSDRPALDYLLDTVGVIGGLLDIGGEVVVDPQTLSVFDAEDWREHLLVPGGAPPRQHVLVLCHATGQGRVSVRTRGMRKFARPDVLIDAVPADKAELAGALAQRLVEMQAMGACFGDGQVLDVDGIGGDLVLRAAGRMDDPQFNNIHWSLRWPTA